MRVKKSNKDKKFIEFVSNLDDEDKNIVMVAIECFALGKKVEQTKKQNQQHSKLKAG